MTRTTLAAAPGLAATLTLAAPAADAATFRFSYDADEGLLLGRLTGTLGPDGNSVVVTAITSLSFGGVAMGPMTELGRAANFSVDPTVTLDGSFINLFALGDFGLPPSGATTAQDALLMQNGSIRPLIEVQDSGVTVVPQTPFEADRWSMAVVPLPASLWPADRRHRWPVRPAPSPGLTGGIHARSMRN